MEKNFCILSIDGGGLKGLIAIKILQVIEKVTGCRIPEKFDLLAGTSTGGLIVCALASGGPGDAAYNLGQIEQMYLEVGEQLFMQGGLSYNAADTEVFDSLLVETFGSRSVSALRKPVLVPAYEVKSGKLVVFKTRSALREKSKDVPVRDICRATTAIPPVFPVYTMRYNGRDIKCADAGPYLKNPALSALAEVWKHKEYYNVPGLSEENISLLSVSTGSYRNQAADWSLDIAEVLNSQEMDMEYIRSQDLRIDFRKIRYLRADMNLGGSAFSLSQMLNWLERIAGLAQNEKFERDIARTLRC